MSELISRGLAVVLFFCLITTSLPVFSQSNILIKAVDQSSCYRSGATIEVYGKGFGEPFAKKVLVLSDGAKQYPMARIEKWSDNAIRASLPKTIASGSTNELMIGVIVSGRWSSNRDVTLRFCTNEPIKKPVLSNSTKAESVFGLRSNVPSNTRNDSDDSNDENNSGASRNASDEDSSQSVDRSANTSENVSVNTELAPRQSGSLSPLGAPPTIDIAATKQSANVETYEPNEVIVVSTSLDEAIALADAIKQFNITIKRRNNYPSLGLVISVLRIPDSYKVPELVAQLRSNNADLWVDVNHRYQLLDSSTQNNIDPKQWAYEAIGWTEAHRQCQQASNIGVIDTGIAELASWPKDQVRRKKILSSGTKEAKKDHGTAIASLLLGSNKDDIPGLLPNATVYSAAIFRERDKKSTDTTAELIIAALAWMAEENITVINLSLGGPRNVIVEAAIKQLLKKSIMIVAAAGVDRQGLPLYPAAQEGVISVRAIDANHQSLSEKIKGDTIDFSAPGVDLWLLNEKGQPRYLSGSSFATPFAAASYLLLNKTKNADDLLSSNQLIELMKELSQDLGPQGKDPYFGFGLIRLPTNC